MAGIGFHLQPLFKKDYYSSKLKAYGFASLITAGPWIIMTAAIGIIQFILGQFSTVNTGERELFIFSVCYCFIFSQIIFSSQQLTATRYVSDLIYEKKYSLIFPAFLGLTKVISVLALLSWGVFAVISPLPLLYKAVLLFLFLTVNQIWVLLLFLSAAKHYQIIVNAFLFGGAAAILSNFTVCWYSDYFTGDYMLPFMLLLGFYLGMSVTMFILFISLLKTFPDWATENQFGYFSYFGKYPMLVGAGILYNLSIWICTWLIWFGEGAQVIQHSFLVHPLYDMAIFWSYLTILPILILFVVSIETRFYLKYIAFFRAVNEGGTLEQIRQAKEKMVTVLWQEIQRVFRIQLIFSGVIIVLAGYIFGQLGLDDQFVNMFRMTAVGAFANGMLLIMFLLLLYFDDQKGALYSTILFFLTNLTLTLAFLPGGIEWFGLSFCIGAFASFIFAALRLMFYLKSLEYHVFCKPAPAQRGNWLTKFGQWLDKKALI
ncbi:exopolysaccharide Pel transporter PelG [Bacillus salacetis]|uniref:exopolysaccharide Pel transporter PelG n=1 Tax=Bacillus salacetis TaxID=2315464 RepID=UPI003B9DEC56